MSNVNLHSSGLILNEFGSRAVGGYSDAPDKELFEHSERMNINQGGSSKDLIPKNEGSLRIRRGDKGSLADYREAIRGSGLF